MKEIERHVQIKEEIKAEKKVAVSNPYKANQYIPDPRQEIFFKYWIDPKSETFGNVYRSARRAGFKKYYAVQLKNRMPTWLQEKVKQVKKNSMVRKAVRNLDEYLDMDCKTITRTKVNKKVVKEVEGRDKHMEKIKFEASRYVNDSMGEGKEEAPKSIHININLDKDQKDKIDKTLKFISKDGVYIKSKE